MIELKDLLAGMKIADEKGRPTPELLEILQRLLDAVRDHETRITALEP